MYFSVRELDIRSIPFKEELAPGVLEWEEGIEQTTPLQASGEASIDESTDEIRVGGHIKVTLQYACDRCLTPVDLPIDEDFELIYQPPPEATPGQELEIHGEDIDVGFHDGEGVELNVVLQEQVLLTMPSRALCKEDCKGLCPSCGVNLNNETCNCTKPNLDDRWAGLRNLGSK